MRPESAAAQRLQRPIRLTQILSAAFRTRTCLRKGYSEESGIPFGLAFHKKTAMSAVPLSNRHKGTGIQRKNQAERSRICCKGKRIVLVDDSIVRGTTISNLITMLRKAGATEVHVRISSPPFLYPCYFGTDVPSNKQLIASSHPRRRSVSRSEPDSLATCRSKSSRTWSVTCRSVVHALTVIIRWKYLKQDISALLESDFVFFFPLTVQILHPVGGFL